MAKLGVAIARVRNLRYLIPGQRKFCLLRSWPSCSPKTPVAGGSHTLHSHTWPIAMWTPHNGLMDFSLMLHWTHLTSEWKLWTLVLLLALLNPQLIFSRTGLKDVELANREIQFHPNKNHSFCASVRKFLL